MKRRTAPNHNRFWRTIMTTNIQSLPGEIWKPVVGYEGLYEVSSIGRVKSIVRTTPIIMKATPNITTGRFQVPLSKKGHVKKRAYVHRMVAEAFHGPCPDGMECCHNDGDHTNNHFNNLRWDTRKANWRDRRAHGNGTEGEKHATGKLKRGDVLAIRARHKPGLLGVLAREFGVRRQTIWSIVHRKTWTHI